MPPHECSREATLARMDAEREAQERRVGEHHRSLYGNGQAGVVADLQDLKIWRGNMDEQRREERKLYNQIRGGLLVGLLLLAADIVLRVIIK